MYNENMRTRERAVQAGIALGLGVVLGLLGLLGLSIGYRLLYLGHIYPGVSVAGVDVSGLRPDEAAERIASAVTYPSQGQIVLSNGQVMWTFTPQELGLMLDAASSAQAAFRVGRRGGLFAPIRLRQQPVDLPPVFIFNEGQAWAILQGLAPLVNTEPQEAFLQINGNQALARDGVPGAILNVDATLSAIRERLYRNESGLVTLVMEEQMPTVLNASEAAAQAEALLSQPLRVRLPDADANETGVWEISPQTLGGWLLFPYENHRYRLVVNPAMLRAWLEDLAETINRQPENARFIFNDDTRQLEVIRPAQIGRTLDVEASLQALQEAITAGRHEADLVVAEMRPEVDDSATAADLGITELVSSYTSYFRGSSGDRIQNIATAAAQFHGLLIPPGATLSMAEVLQDISLENGYAEALIIYNGRTIKGVGGGVCQVSTTLFRTAFFGGYPIVERHPHAYRVGYYEQTANGHDTSLAGLDATVYIPLVDFKFTNDTPYWLLLETYVNVGARRLTWKFYSTSDGRSVEWQTTGLQNITPPPPPKFIPNEELAPGKMRQVDWGIEGADVSVTRTVYRGGQVYLQDTFNTHYEPWQAICEYAPNIDDPEARARELGLCQP